MSTMLFTYFLTDLFDELDSQGLEEIKFKLLAYYDGIVLLSDSVVVLGRVIRTKNTILIVRLVVT